MGPGPGRGARGPGLGARGPGPGAGARGPGPGAWGPGPGAAVVVVISKGVASLNDIACTTLPKRECAAENGKQFTS